MLLDRLKSMPGHLLRRAQQRVTAIFGDEMAGVDLTSVQFIALAAIADIPGLDATRLSEVIHHDRATIGGVIERLERKGLIARTQREQDRRTKELTVTENGKALIATCFERVDAVQQQFLAPLAKEEQEMFMMLLARLTNAPDSRINMPATSFRSTGSRRSPGSLTGS